MGAYIQRLNFRRITIGFICIQIRAFAKLKILYVIFQTKQCLFVYNSIGYFSQQASECELFACF